MPKKFQDTTQKFKECCLRQGMDIINSSSTEVSFATKGYLKYFDEDVARAIIGNKQSFVYHPGGYNYSDRISYADIEQLMTAILLDGTLKVKLCAAFKYDIDQGISSISTARHTMKRKILRQFVGYSRLLVWIRGKN